MKGTKSNNNQKNPLPQSWRNFVRKLLALGDIDVTFVWPLRPLVTLAWLLRGRHGAFSGGALGRTLRFAWHWWHAWSPVAPPPFAWQAWVPQGTCPSWVCWALVQGPVLIKSANCLPTDSSHTPNLFCHTRACWFTASAPINACWDARNC